jgi:nucleoid-associated protein YgaU
MGAGADVERITGDTLTEVEDVLDQLATEGRRFVARVPEPPPPTTAPTVYVVQPGNTLWSISTKVYGTGSLSQIIFEANRDILNDPGRIRPGQVLKIPPKP